MPDEQKARHESEYQKLLALFISMLKAQGGDGRTDALYELAEQRAEYAIEYALEGLELDYASALELIRSVGDENLTQHDKDIRDRAIAAIENLIDFAVCEEYQLYDEVLEAIADGEIEFDDDELDEYVALCRKYNDQYASVENGDILYAAAMAAWWCKLSAMDYVVYWTQNDTRVRPWHMALQGYAAPMDEFPSWMIPPIEYNCRCFLTSLEVGAFNKANDLGKIKASAPKIQKPKELTGVFKESLAKCGRIFSDAHPYFNVKEKDKAMLQGMVQKLREKYGI